MVELRMCNSNSYHTNFFYFLVLLLTDYDSDNKKEEEENNFDKKTRFFQIFIDIFIYYNLQILICLERMEEK